MSENDADRLQRMFNEVCARNNELRMFARRMLDPEDFGYAVTAEVRNAAREVLNIPQREPVI